MIQKSAIRNPEILNEGRRDRGGGVSRDHRIFAVTAPLPLCGRSGFGVGSALRIKDPGIADF